MATDREHGWMPLPAAVRKRAGLVLTPKGRRKTGLFLVEGFRLFESALEYHWPIEAVIVRDDGAALARLAALLASHQVGKAPVYIAALKVFDHLTSTVEPAGVVALARQKSPVSDEQHLIGKKLLIADNVRDPGNLGAVVRSAAAFAVDGVYLSTGCVELYNPKVVRATMGAVFGVPVCAEVEPAALGEKLREGGFTIFVANPREGLRLQDIRPPSRWALVIGGETHGCAESWRTWGARPVRIPMTARVESLNSAVAAGIILYHLTNPPHPARTFMSAAARHTRQKRV